MENNKYTSKGIIDTKESRNNSTKTLVDNIKNKLNSAYSDYGRTENEDENIDACLPREPKLTPIEYTGTKDSSSSEYSYNIINTTETARFDNQDPKYLKDYYVNINNNLEEIKGRLDFLPEE